MLSKNNDLLNIKLLNICYYLTFFILYILLLPFSLISQNESQSHLQSQSNILSENRIGIGYDVLNNEKENGFDIDDISYLVLDSIIYQISSQIKIKPNYTSNELKDIFYKIGANLKSLGYYNDTTSLYSTALINKKFDCKFYLFTYMTICQKLGINISSMHAPSHVFLYYNSNNRGNNEEIYWETTSNFQSNRQFYIDSLNISKEQIKSKLYLSPKLIQTTKSLYLNNTGISHLLSHNYKKAFENFTLAVNNDNTFLGALYNLGITNINLKNYSQALNNFDTVIKYIPDFNNCYNNRGLVKYKLGLINESIIDYNMSIKLDSNNIDTYNNRSLAYLDKGIKMKALDDITKAYKLDSNNLNTLYNRAKIYFEMSELEKALIDYKKIYIQNPKYKNTLYNMCNIKIDLKFYNDAIIDLEKLIEIEPNNYIYYFHLGMIYFDENQIEKATINFSKSIEINPNCFECLVNRANIYYQIQDNDKAILDFMSALKLKKDCDICWYNLGIIYFNQNKLSDACNCFKQAKELKMQEAINTYKENCK